MLIDEAPMADGGTALAPQGLGQSIFQALMGRERGGGGQQMKLIGVLRDLR